MLVVSIKTTSVPWPSYRFGNLTRRTAACFFGGEKPTHRVYFTVTLPCRPYRQGKTEITQLKEKENDARTQLDIPQNIMMRVLDERREDKFILQGCAERFIGHRAVAGDSSLTDKFECVMPAAAGDEPQTHISNDKRIRFTAMVIQ